MNLILDKVPAEQLLGFVFWFGVFLLTNSYNVMQWQKKNIDSS